MQVRICEGRYLLQSSASGAAASGGDSGSSSSSAAAASSGSASTSAAASAGSAAAASAAAQAAGVLTATPLPTINRRSCLKSAAHIENLSWWFIRVCKLIKQRHAIADIEISISECGLVCDVSKAFEFHQRYSFMILRVTSYH